MSEVVPQPGAPLLGWRAPGSARAPVAGGVVRARLALLLDTLLTPGPERRLGLVVAPAGSGKTTAVAHWVADRAASTVWLRVPSGAGPGELSCAARAAVAALPPARGAGPVVLVLDDVQHLVGPDAPPELEELVLTAPDGVVLLLLSRAPVPLDLARAELPQPLRIGREELRLLPHELQAALQQLGAGRLPAPVAVALADRSDGWPAAVPLLAQAGPQGLRVLAGRPADDGVPWAAEYLERQVLGTLPAELRDLLVRCSHLQVLDAQRCDVVTEGAGGAAALRELARQGVVEPVPGTVGAYRCHPVLRRYLRGELVPGAVPVPLPLSLTAARDRTGRDDALALLLRGDRRAATALLAGLPAQACPAGRLAWHALQGLLDDAPDALPAVADLQRTLHVDLGRSLTAGLAALLDGAPSFALELADDLDGQGDVAAALALRAAAAVAGWRGGSPDLELLDRLVLDSRRLGAGSDAAPESWARALRALVGARLQLPDADGEAAAAEAVARRAGLPGPAALACAALALTRPAQARDLLRLAEDGAEAAGLLCRPWEWGPGAAPAPSPAGPQPTPSVPAVHVACFGSFALDVDGAAPDLSALRPRARALLRLLALHGGVPVHREQLVDALWSELPLRAGMHNLQVAVSSLRQVLEPGRPGRASVLLPRRGEAYALELGPDGSTDLHAFDTALLAAEQADDVGARSLLQTALALYRGDVLVEDGPVDWVVDVRERYRLRAAEAAGRLAELRLAAGNAPGAVAAATRSVELDRYRDASWRLLVAASTQAGDVARAARTAQAYQALLDELGLHAELPLPPAQRGARSTSPTATSPPRHVP